jgi:hypothetical protein
MVLAMTVPAPAGVRASASIRSPTRFCTASERRPGSRPSCQIRVVAALDGLLVRTPERQP